MQAPSRTPPNTTVTVARTAQAAEPETLDVVWIGDAQGVEEKLPGIAPHVRVSVLDTATAVDALRSGTAHADVVVIDTTTPRADARDILQQMKAAGTDLPILLLTTMSGSGQLAQDASQLATCDVVVKMPGFEQQLPAALSQVRARHDLAAMFRESRQSQERLRTILEFQPAVMCVIGPDAVLSAVNQAGLSLLGAGHEQIVGRSLASFLPPEERDEFLDLARRACSGEPCVLDHSVLKADGSRADVRTQAVPFEKSHGRVALVTIRERSGPSAEELASLTGQRDALAVALRDSKAQLDQVQVERTQDSARADALSSELFESVAALNGERERSSGLVAELATARSMLEQLTGQGDSIALALRDANAQLAQVQFERTQESARADALSSELFQSVAALNAERQRSNDLVAEMATAKSTLDQLTGQGDALATALREANAHLNEARGERAREAARADALSSELTESVAALNESVAALSVERVRSSDLLVEMATTRSMLDQLTGQGEALTIALREADAQLNEIRNERAQEAARAEALSSELAESLSALKVERERSHDLLVELATTKSMLEQSSRLQTVLEADHQSMQNLREQLRRFTEDADRLCSGIIERQQGTLARLEGVADPTV